MKGVLMRLLRVLLAAALCISMLTTAAGSADKGGIDKSLLGEFETKFEAQGDHRRIMNAVAANDIKQLSINREVLLKHDKFFNLKLDGTDIINQQSSGRCWMFAGVNILAPQIVKQLKISDFEFSEPYLAFYDKLEKANFFLERIIEMRDRPIDDRSLQLEIEYFFGDGGWWHFFTDLIKKYGVVPISAMPETKQSSATGNFNRLAKSLLRGHASRLRQMHQDGHGEKELRQAKEEMLADIYKLLVYVYGKPPKEFTFRYKDKDDSTKAYTEKKYTPKSFYEEFLGDMPEYVALCNNPTKDFDQLFLLEMSRNIWENEDFEILNLPIEKLKEYTLKSLVDSQGVWFSCDVGEQNLGDSGIFAVNLYDYGTALGMDFSLTKAERLAFKEVTPNHAMAIMGVDTSATGKPLKWLVENSWGTKRGDDGHWYMYDDWFDEYVLVVIIDKRLLSEEDARKFEQTPVKIADWEPFFLALRNLQ